MIFSIFQSCFSYRKPTILRPQTTPPFMELIPKLTTLTNRNYCNITIDGDLPHSFSQASIACFDERRTADILTVNILALKTRLQQNNQLFNDSDRALLTFIKNQLSAIEIIQQSENANITLTLSSFRNDTDSPISTSAILHTEQEVCTASTPTRVQEHLKELPKNLCIVLAIVVAASIFWAISRQSSDNPESKRHDINFDNVDDCNLIKNLFFWIQSFIRATDEYPFNGPNSNVKVLKGNNQLTFFCKEQIST